MKRLLFVVPVCAAWIVGACGDDDTSPKDDVVTPSPDAGTDGSHAGHDAGREDAGGGEDASVPLRCSDEELAANTVTDGGEVVVEFATNESTTQYTNHCVTVKAGSSVTFKGSFLNHPLEPAGGDEPTPIPYTSTNQPDHTLVVTFPDAGTFGYRCEFHPANMYGAIRVVP